LAKELAGATVVAAADVLGVAAAPPLGLADAPRAD
jgi:hypothetical protein